jgi:hypothetical protein
MYYIILNALFNTLYICCWFYFLSIIFYDKYVYPLKINLDIIQKQHEIICSPIKFISNTPSPINIQQTITFPHYTINYESDNPRKNIIISYQLAELLNVQPGLCTSEDHIYNLVFKYIKKNCSIYHNQVTIIPKHLQLLFGIDSYNMPLNKLPNYIQPHIKHI